MLSPNHSLLQMSSGHTSPPHLQDQAFPGCPNIAVLNQPVGFLQEAIQLDLLVAPFSPLFLAQSSRSIVCLLNEWVN